MTLHDPFGRSRLPVPVSDRAASVDALRRIVGILRAQPCEEARHVADGLERWLLEGGSLESCLGVKPRRGGRWQVARAAARKQARDQLIIELASRTGERGRTAQAEAVVRFIGADETVRDRLRRFGGVESLSASQVRRILAKSEGSHAAHQIAI